MSVLIKGMEMPKKCGQCKLYHAEHPMHCMAVEGHRTVGAPYGMPRPDWCPLVEVPDKHGDLIDRDVFKEYFFRPYSNEEVYSNIEIANIVNAQPVIIEAERNKK